MSVYKVSGIVIVVLVIGCVVLNQSAFEKDHFAIAAFGLALNSIPAGYKFDSINLIFWGLMSVTLIFFVNATDLFSFILFGVFIALGKFAGLELSADDDNWHDDHWVDSHGDDD